MAAFVTDQFRILNAGSFVESISNNSYYAFLGLSNPKSPDPGFGRDVNWDTSTNNNPVDNLQYLYHYRDTSLFGKKITTENARRVVRRIDWISDNQYDMYRHDYKQGNQSPVNKSLTLYGAEYYVITDEFKIYVCLDNGTSGPTGPNDNVTVPLSTVKPTHTDAQPAKLSDGYVWQYLFKVSPADVIKFDSTEFFVVPNNWLTTTDSDIQIIRDGGNSDNNNNQIRKVYIENGGTGYTQGPADIIGDGTGGKVNIEVTNSIITEVTVTQGGRGYTYGAINLRSQSGQNAKLIPIIPPSKGHGYNIYQELGTDKVLLYARFDDSTKDFPTDTKFAQVGIIKNPETFGGGTTFTDNQFSSLFAIKLTSEVTLNKGDILTQTVTTNNVTTVAKGYVASYDKETNIVKYYQDRSLSFGNKVDQIDNNLTSAIVGFSTAVIGLSPAGTIDTSFNGSVITINSKQINLGVTFSKGLASPEINKKTGDIIYIDNRPEVQRDSRQKEDVKIILEF